MGTWVIIKDSAQEFVQLLSRIFLSMTLTDHTMGVRARAAVLLSPNLLPCPTSLSRLSVPLMRPLSRWRRFRIKRSTSLFLLPNFFPFLFDSLFHRSLPTLSSKCIILGLVQQSPFLSCRATPVNQQTCARQWRNPLLHSFMCQAPLPVFLFSFSSCFAFRSASCSSRSLLSRSTLLSARFTACSNLATSCSRSSR